MSLLLKLAGKGRRAFEKLERGLACTESSSKTVYSSFAEAKKTCETATPYQDSDLIEVIFAKTPRYINSLPTDTFISQNEVNLTLFLTQLFNKKTISVIDIGGACGAQYFFLRKLLPDSVRLSWRVVETPAMVARASDWLRTSSRSTPISKAPPRKEAPMPCWPPASFNTCPNPMNT